MRSRLPAFRHAPALFAGLLLLGLTPLTARAGDEHAHHHHHHHAASAVSRSETSVVLPRVSLRSQDGATLVLADALDDGRPVLLNFIYTSCTAICPPMTRIFAEVQEGLGADRQRVRLVSVSIDPEQDTPRRLKDYARQFGAAEPWLFLTGSTAASTAVQKAFNSYRPDKMGHTPVSFLRRGPGQPWVRLDGLAQAGDILRELRPMLPPRP
ncbi:SCO family protein [Zoogloea sp.]|uniref:SCO family protein n=1 Tax=Zoogloea sp. TaxID=49181 RepID=UPI0025FEC111|nr:SCO family protein [Zoogloea sp.]MCK6393561.1 SCO family protein [Zoogloea sp.]